MYYMYASDCILLDDIIISNFLTFTEITFSDFSLIMKNFFSLTIYFLTCGIPFGQDTSLSIHLYEYQQN